MNKQGLFGCVANRRPYGLSLSRAPERQAARSQAKPKQRIAHWADNELFCS